MEKLIAGSINKPAIIDIECRIIDGHSGQRDFFPQRRDSVEAKEFFFSQSKNETMPVIIYLIIEQIVVLAFSIISIVPEQSSSGIHPYRSKSILRNGNY